MIEMLNFNTELQEVKTLADVARHRVWTLWCQTPTPLAYPMAASAVCAEKMCIGSRCQNQVPLIKIYLFKTPELVRPSSAAGSREFHNDTR